MTDSSSAVRKLQRAREHIGTLRNGIDDFLKAQPYAVGRRLQAKGRVHEYLLIRYTPAPDSLGLLVGDAVHNLRSCLDHLAFSLAQEGAKAAGITMTSKEEAQLQFPICDTPNDFKKQVGRGRLRGVEPHAQALIERYQPFRLAPQHPERSVLGCLARLDNADKHRVLLVTSHVVSLGDYSLPSGVERPVEKFPRIDSWGLGTVVVRYIFAEPHPEVDMDLAPNYTLAIDGAWPPTRPAHEVLESYAVWIETCLLGQTKGPTPGS